MQLKSLRLFLAVVETGSFVAAAERLHTVQSNVTAHIKKLETELGVQLVERNAPVRPTSAGRALEGYAQGILRQHDEAIAFFKGSVPPSGELRIGSMETTAALRLPPLLNTFHAAYPLVRIALTVGPTAELRDGLLAGRFDCIFMAGRLVHRQFFLQKAFSERLVLVSARPLQRLPDPELLASSSFLAFRQGCSYRQRIEVLLNHCGVSATRIAEFGSLDAMLGCVAAGMGYALLPAAVIEAQKYRFDIHMLEIPEEIANIDTYFVANETQTWTPAIHSLHRLLNGECA